MPQCAGEQGDSNVTLGRRIGHDLAKHACGVCKEFECFELVRYFARPLHFHHEWVPAFLGNHAEGAVFNLVFTSGKCLLE